MIISEITINEFREIDSIKLKINDGLIEYISSQDGVSISDTSSIFALSRVGLATIDFDIAIEFNICNSEGNYAFYEIII